MKKLFSVLLALLMMAGVIAVAPIAVSAAGDSSQTNFRSFFFPE